MSAIQKYVVVPYRKNRRALVACEMRNASTAASAERIAQSMASRFAGVAAYEVTVDEETGDLLEPHLLVCHGEVAEIHTE